MLKHPRGGSSGFSLIEVLITMLVVSIGLLGVAALQAKSLQHAYASYQRTLATVQANDAVERLWARVCDLPDELSDIEDEWVDEWEDDPRMPDWDGMIEEAGGLYTITIEWADRVDANKIEFSFSTAIPNLPGCTP